jgi:hypothetical protein
VWPAKDLGELLSYPTGEWPRLAGRPGGCAHVGRWSSQRSEVVVMLTSGLVGRSGWLGDLVIVLTSGLIGERSKVVEIKGSIVAEMGGVEAGGGRGSNCIRKP